MWTMAQEQLLGVVVTLLVASCGGQTIEQGCSSDKDCGGVCIENLPGGLCTLECTSSSDCPAGAVCADTEVQGGICLFECDNTDECVEAVGSGYVCDTETEMPSGEDVRVCID